MAISEPNIEERWVPARYLEPLGFPQDCPLIDWTGPVVDDTFLLDLGDTIESIPLHLTLDRTPNILILELGALKNEFGVQLATTSIEAQLNAVFALCNGNVHRRRIESLGVLEAFMFRSATFGHHWTHVVIVGHANSEGLCFVDEANPRSLEPKLAGGAELAKALVMEFAPSFEVISVCCESGCVEVTRELSKQASCAAVVAPIDNFHIADAGPFVNEYFKNRYRRLMAVGDAMRAASPFAAEADLAGWVDGIPLAPASIAS